MSYKELSSNIAVVLTERIKTELMTCHEIVATGRYPYTGRLGILTPEDEQIVDEAMKAVHAEDLGNRAGPAAAVSCRINKRIAYRDQVITVRNPFLAF